MPAENANGQVPGTGDPKFSDPKLNELTALIQEIRERVRGRYAVDPSKPGTIAVPDLVPILHARDAAFGKVASIGRVNPRPGGLLNSIVQSVKRFVSRTMDWHVREQVEYNRAMIGAIEAVLAVLEENNRVFQELAARIPRVSDYEQRLDAALGPLEQETRDTAAHWIAWRSEWERKLATNEMQFMRGLADLQNAFNHRATLMESNYREMAKGQHSDFEGAIARANEGMQQRFWAEVDKVRLQYEAMIRNELRAVRERPSLLGPPAAGAAPQHPGAPEGFDYWKFSERFRGPEEYVRKNNEYYVEHFGKGKNVVDLGCGRGEFLETMRDHGIAARGVELSVELVTHCRNKGLAAEHADLFEWLRRSGDAVVDGIFCAQVAEHLPPERVPELIRLAWSRLAPGGVLCIETPNPECLSIFATHFYMDPTHVRPIPPKLMEFYFDEYGFGQLHTRRFAPAVEAVPELASLPEALRSALFGAQDYAVIGRRLG